MRGKIVANKLTDNLGGRQVLRGAELLKCLLFRRINQHRQACSFGFHKPEEKWGSMVI